MTHTHVPVDTPRRVRNAANLVNLSTPLGALLGVIGRGRLRNRAGLVVFDEVRLPGVRASAMTVGSVVLVMGRRLEQVEQRIPGLLRHEDEHAWQYAACLGLPMLPLYGVAAGWSWLRTGNRASANLFEQAAGLTRGGYRRASRRSLRQGWAEMSRRAQPWRRRADRAA